MINFNNQGAIRSEIKEIYMNPMMIIGPLSEFVIRTYKEKKLKKTSISVSCSRCHSKGSHKFYRLEPSGLLPYSGKKIFLCNNCNAELREDGIAITTLMDRIEAFFNAGELKDSIAALETLVATSNTLSAKDRKDIIRLKEEFQKVNIDKELLKNQLRELIERLKKASQK